jgi:HD-GYP domain-containing protein (c-di-GMP phosphodiesterase class II)
MGLSALLHDVGKTNTNPNIVRSSNKLDSDEFKEFQTHTTIGYQLIGKCKFSNPDLKITALQHHERLDGSGYPKKLTHISKTAQIIGIIDSYESLTKDNRPYRNSLESLKALTILKNEVEAGKLNRKIFEKFAYSLM